MKLAAEQALLSKALSWVGMALPTRTPYPALMGVHLRADQDALTLTLTGYDDLGAHIRRIPAEVSETGQALIPGALLRDLVNALPRGTVELAANKHAAGVETGSATYRLGVLPIDDYPLIPNVPELVGTVRAGELADMLSAIAPAVDDVPDTARGGIHIEGKGGSLSLAGVSTPLVIYRATRWSGDDFRERMSPGLFRDAVKGFEPDASLEIGCSHGLLSLSDGSRTAVTRLYDRADMNWRKLLRIDPDPNSVTVDIGSLSNALRRATLLNPGVVKLSANTDDLWLKLESDEGSLELINAPKVRGRVDISLNPAYLNEAIQAVRGPSELVRIGATDKPRTPVLIWSADAEVDGAAVIAPKNDR